MVLAKNVLGNESLFVVVHVSLMSKVMNHQGNFVV